jgi:hypothetical protein
MLALSNFVLLDGIRLGARRLAAGARSVFRRLPARITTRAARRPDLSPGAGVDLRTSAKLLVLVPQRLARRLIARTEHVDCTEVTTERDGLAVSTDASMHLIRESGQLSTGSLDGRAVIITDLTIDYVREGEASHDLVREAAEAMNVRLGALQDPDVARYLAHDVDDDIRIIATWNPAITDDQLRKLVEDNRGRVRQAANDALARRGKKGTV